MLEYNALKPAVGSNHRPVIIPQEINTKVGPLSNLSYRMIRNVFDKLKNHDICAAKFWKQKTNVNIDYFSITHESTKESKFIHNIYPTNILLNKMGLAIPPPPLLQQKTATQKNPKHQQNIWGRTVDYIEQCTKLENFRRNVKQYILIRFHSRLEINEKVALFGVSKSLIEDAEIRNRINHIILIAKLAISKYKYGKCK